jgi:hypothetical protein
LNTGAITATSLTSSGNISSTSVNTGTLTATSLVTNTLRVIGGIYTTTGAVLTSDGNGNAVWGGSGLYTLNGVTAASQTFSTTNINTSPVGITSSVSGGTATHTFNIPDAYSNADGSGVTRGLLSSGTQNIGGEKSFTASSTFVKNLIADGTVSATQFRLNSNPVTPIPTYTVGSVMTASDNIGTATWSTNLNVGTISSTSVNTGTLTATSATLANLKFTNGAPTTVGAVLTATATDGTVGWSTTNSATSLSGGVAGAIPFQTAPNTTGFTAAGTSGQILVSAGTATPTWTSNITVGTATATSLVTNTLRVTGGSFTTTGAVLTSDGNGNATWGGSGLYTLNGITATNQTFAATTTSTSTSPSFTSTGTVHTLNIPSASVTGTTAGLISNTEFKSKLNVVDTAAMLATYARKFTKNVTLRIGSGKSLGKYQNGQTIPAAGKTMDEFLEDIATETIAPTYTAPTVRMNPNTNTVVEIGTNPGTISLGNVYTQNDGGAVTTTTYSKNGADLGSATSNAPGQITETLTYSVNVAYAQGPVKNNNLGNPDPTGQISASNVSSSSNLTYTPQAKKYWGSSTSNTLNNGTLINNSSEFYNDPAKGTFSISVTGSQYVFYAYPASGADLTSISVGGFESINSFTKSTITINNHQGYQQSYKLYVSNNNFSANVTNIIIQ